jgi:hypothetical protein
MYGLSDDGSVEHEFGSSDDSDLEHDFELPGDSEWSADYLTESDVATPEDDAPCTVPAPAPARDEQPASPCLRLSLLDFCIS